LTLIGIRVLLGRVGAGFRVVTGGLVVVMLRRNNSGEDAISP